MKTCPDCGFTHDNRKKICDCGTRLPTLVKKTKKNPSSRKSFIKRMLGNKKSQNYALDMKVATEIFERFDHDLDFLSKVKPPFELEGSIKFFLTPAGQAYLIRKYREFHFEVENQEKFVDADRKVGDDKSVVSTPTLRQFLNE